MGATAADVTLQVIRGPGTVTSSVPTSKPERPHARSDPSRFRATDVHPGRHGRAHCNPNGSDASFAGWSTADCPTACRLTVDDDGSVVALFSKLTLRVALSGNNGDELVTSAPAGISCPPKCEFDFNARSTVRLTVNLGNSKLTSFPFGCTSVEANACIVTMLDDPQTVGVKFNNAGGLTRRTSSTSRSA
jgi:hypothetical protein